MHQLIMEEKQVPVMTTLVQAQLVELLCILAAHQRTYKYKPMLH